MFRKRTLDAKSAIFHFAFDSSFFGFRDLGEQRVWTLELWPSRSEVIENRYPHRAIHNIFSLEFGKN